MAKIVTLSRDTILGLITQVWGLKSDYYLLLIATIYYLNLLNWNYWKALSDVCAIQARAL